METQQQALDASSDPPTQRGAAGLLAARCSLIPLGQGPRGLVRLVERSEAGAGSAEVGGIVANSSLRLTA